MAKTNREKNRESEARRRARGQKKICVWVPLLREAELKAIAAKWCGEHDAAQQRLRAARFAAIVAGGGAL